MALALQDLVAVPASRITPKAKVLAPAADVEIQPPILQIIILRAVGNTGDGEARVVDGAAAAATAIDDCL